MTGTEFYYEPHSGVRPSRTLTVLEVVGIFILFALYAGSPPPDVNETAYLCKAKHYWNPDWCPGDLFLESADAHLVFYWTFGWLTRLVSLPIAAWIGRVILWIGLSVAWRSLNVSLVARPGVALLTAALWLLGLHYCHMMGEWVVGSIEGKSVAYVFILFGLAALVRNQWNRTWVWFGAATMFHVVVGGWSVVAAGIAWLLQAETRPPLRAMWPGLLAGVLLSLPGLVPALWLTQGVPHATLEQAGIIYVFRRLSHHLVVQTRPVHFVARFLGLVAIWAMLYVVLRRQPSARRLQTFVAGTVLIALVGVLISLSTFMRPESAARWLRYYWFRLADAAVPAGVALGLAVWLADKCGRAWAKSVWLAMTMGVFCAAGGLIVTWPTIWTTQLPRASLHEWGFGGSNRFFALQSHREWVQMCAWVGDNTVDDAQFLTPYNQQTFKWYAGRSEAATWKDIPQDAQSTVAWWGRITDIYQLHNSAGHGAEKQRVRLVSLTELDGQRLITLARKYECHYIILDCYQREPDIDTSLLVYSAAGSPASRFRVYAVPDESGPLQTDDEH